MALLAFPDLGIGVDAGQVLPLKSHGAREAWSRAAGEKPGPIFYKGNDIVSWTPARRFAEGLLVLFPKPEAPEGFTLGQLLRCGKPLAGLRAALREEANFMGLPAELLDAPLEDPRLEWLQALVLKPVCVVAAADAEEAWTRRLARRGTAVLLS